MINKCPHCQEGLSFSKDQHQKISKALSALGKGKHLSLKCPRCKQTIKLENTAAGQAATQVTPPAPPKLDWLASGAFQGEEKVEDVPMALLLHEATAQRELISSSIEAVGYQVILEESPEAAIERMRFVNFACVIYQADLDGSFDQSKFHSYLRNMSMDRRRYILYIVIGPDFNTLYNLEALAHSANLTINTSDLAHMEIILKKAIPDYEELFGPYLEEMSAYGKS